MGFSRGAEGFSDSGSSDEVGAYITYGSETVLIAVIEATGSRTRRGNVFANEKE